MLSTVLSRHDRNKDDGHFKSIWSLKIPGCHPVFDEYLVCLYAVSDLDDSIPVVRYREDLTHEVCVVTLAPDVRVDFNRDVFLQSKLIPLTPPNHAYQFKADSNDSAIARVQVLVNSMLAGTLSPEADPAGHWGMLFMDGVKLNA